MAFSSRNVTSILFFVISLFLAAAATFVAAESVAEIKSKEVSCFLPGSTGADNKDWRDGQMSNNPKFAFNTFGSTPAIHTPYGFAVGFYVRDLHAAGCTAYECPQFDWTAIEIPVTKTEYASLSDSERQDMYLRYLNTSEGAAGQLAKKHTGSARVENYPSAIVITDTKSQVFVLSISMQNETSHGGKIDPISVAVAMGDLSAEARNCNVDIGLVIAAVLIGVVIVFAIIVAIVVVAIIVVKKKFGPRVPKNRLQGIGSQPYANL